MKNNPAPFPTTPNQHHADMLLAFEALEKLFAITTLPFDNPLWDRIETRLTALRTEKPDSVQEPKRDAVEEHCEDFGPMAKPGTEPEAFTVWLKNNPEVPYDCVEWCRNAFESASKKG